MIHEVIFRAYKACNRTTYPDYRVLLRNVSIADFVTNAVVLINRYAIVNALITDNRGTRFISSDALINLIK